MMAAKKAQHRITAPHAKYSNSGQLSCTLCGLAIKHESLWGAHVQSKAHRVNVQKLEAEQRQAAAEAERSSAKRRREDGPGDDEEGGEGDASKRARDGDEVGRLPSGFFADPSQAPPPAPSTSSSAAGAGTNGSSTSVANQGRDAAQEGEEDPEWAEFEKYLASGNAGPAQDNNGATRSTASATIKAAPVKFEFGAPVVEEDGEGGAGGEDDEPDEEEEQETEEERTEREMREEREEMMARLEEEEREQREADEKVTALKKRLEAIRAARQKK